MRNYPSVTGGTTGMLDIYSRVSDYLTEFLTRRSAVRGGHNLRISCAACRLALGEDSRTVGPNALRTGRNVNGRSG